MAEILLELREITKSFETSQGKLEILKKINLKIQKGEKISIVGPSGVGKTTLLNIIGTLDYPSSGEILFLGEKINFSDEEKLSQLRKEKIGFIFQLHYLIPEFTVVENIILPGLISNFKKEDCERRAEELLRRFNLLKRKEHKPSQLSGGERQKVAIARALFLNPPLLLADEPTGNLDPESAKEVAEVFLKVNEELNTTIILVTHNLELAQKMDKIFLLKNGFLVELEEKKIKGL
ncbi:MAG: ABC transporter ATP-binding protein [Thermodesulfobacteriaceae bacterium]|nr:ABC transporter ATP-binding protein [Thermodesulfobacteriaceae bacterium]MCX8041790.1 ABC transporter ATP-binding protein [Thermodesulfobacteriaceae bacterium]MDW8135201.1 ABC transporter ATP-binding protein [Thermodesulfobacterium sp.]